MKEITIYTDGACSGNPGPGGWGGFCRAKSEKCPHSLLRQAGEPLGDDERPTRCRLEAQ